MTMSRVVTVPKCRRTWRTMLLSGAAIPRLASARPDSAYRIGDEAIVLPGPPQDFNITLPGAELTTGQTAEVLTRLPQGHTLYWEITALCAHRSELVEGLLEVPYEITFLGAGDDGNPVIQPAVAVPVLTAAESAESADSVDSAEGADAAAEVPSHVEELVEGATYRGTVVTGVRPGCGVGTTGICFEFQAQGPTWTRCTAGSCSGADWNLSREFQSIMYALSSRGL